MLVENLKNLLEKPRDRRDFLKNVGLGLIGLVGMTTIISSLTKDNTDKQASSQLGDSSAYGATTYGG